MRIASLDGRNLFPIPNEQDHNDCQHQYHTAVNREIAKQYVNQSMRCGSDLADSEIKADDLYNDINKEKSKQFP